jgi:ectoine hydroxylase-related dioxygenase (phytanoyl-CoA dioxygenase family)
MTLKSIPQSAYGILQRDGFDSELKVIAEQVRRLGYAILDSGYTAEQLKEIPEAFGRVCLKYIRNWGEANLKSLNEFHTVRAPPTHGEVVFVQLAMNQNLMAVLQGLIAGSFILNLQNGIINPPGETYNQSAWHGDLPYQHYVSSTPLTVNAIFCVDDFNFENGSNFGLPAWHKGVTFLSESYVNSNAVQVRLKQGNIFCLIACLFIVVASIGQLKSAGRSTIFL